MKRHDDHRGAVMSEGNFRIRDCCVSLIPFAFAASRHRTAMHATKLHCQRGSSRLSRGRQTLRLAFTASSHKQGFSRLPLVPQSASPGSQRPTSLVKQIASLCLHAEGCQHPKCGTRGLQDWFAESSSRIKGPIGGLDETCLGA